MLITVRLKVHWYPNTSWTGNDISFNLRVTQEYFEPSCSDKMRDKNLLKVNDHEGTMALLRLKSKKHLNEIWPLIKCQPLLREIVTVYIIKTFLKKKFITKYTHTGQTIKLEDTTVQPKAAVCDQSGFRVPNLHLIILAPIMHTFSLTWKDSIKDRLQSPVLWPI